MQCAKAKEMPAYYKRTKIQKSKNILPTWKKNLRSLPLNQTVQKQGRKLKQGILTLY